MMMEGTLRYCIPLSCATTNFSQLEISKAETVRYFWNDDIRSTNYRWPDHRNIGLHNTNSWTIPVVDTSDSNNSQMRRRRAGTLIGFSKKYKEAANPNNKTTDIDSFFPLSSSHFPRNRMDATPLSMDSHPIVSTPALTRSSNGSSSNDSTSLSPLPEQIQTFSTPPSSIHNQPLFHSPDMSKRGGLCIKISDPTKEDDIGVPSSVIANDGSFTPYVMQTVEPRAPELKARDKVVSRSSSLRRPRAQSKSASPILPMTHGILTPVSGGQNTAASSPTPYNTLKRSLSTLLKRSTSLVRRNPNKSVDMTATPPSPLTVNTIDISLSPPPVNTTRERGYTDALSSSAFNVTMTNSTISPLIGNSMVHVKVIVNPDTIIVAPMMRSIVFARARERILTKLFQCGVPFVETKPCKLAIRKQLDNGEERMVAIENNQAWRNVMDAAGSYEHANNGVSSPSCVRRVVKLVLHLIPPEKSLMQ